MDRLSILLSFAIVWLSLSYVLFTTSQYFSVLSIIIIFIIALSAFLVFLLCYKYSSGGKLNIPSMRMDRLIVAFLVIITIFAVFEIAYDSVGNSILGSTPIVVILVTVGVALSIVGLYLIRRFTKAMTKRALWVAIIIGVIITASVAFWVMYGIRSVNWNGIDELGFNYYAAYVFVHGHNPYLTSMAPILEQRGISPTVQLDGTYEFAYDYPAMSFLPYLFMPLLGISDFFVFILIAIILSVLAAYLVYWRSGFNNLVLIPLAAWLFATYTLVGTTNQYLCISVLFLIAYIERKNVLLAGVLVGIAASVIQLVWFAIPFFFILIWREYGSTSFLKSVGAAIVTFAIINSYFLIVSPVAFFVNNFSVFGLTKLTFYGPNIMQLLVSHYSVASWYSAGISVMTLLAFMVLFYYYTDTLKPLVAVLPAMIFFLSWRNISIYGLPFIPVILAVYYVHDHDVKVTDIIKSKKPMLYSIGALIVLFIALAVYSHSTYTKAPILTVGAITPIIYGQSQYSGPYALGGVRINVINNGSKVEPVSFFIVSRDPNSQNYLLSPSFNGTQGPEYLLPHTSANYTLPYQLSTVQNGTALYVFAFSPDYISYKEYNIELAH